MCSTCSTCLSRGKSRQRLSILRENSIQESDNEETKLEKGNETPNTTGKANKESIIGDRGSLRTTSHFLK